MREILFRAKRVENGEWVEGYYLKTTLGKDIEPSDVIFVPFKINRSGQWGWIKVLPETLCQYTGLNDGNGNRIWENDIVRSGTNMVVKWSERFAGWCLYQNRWMYEHFFGEAVDERDCEVVGNVFDNPELLKK